MKQKGYYAPPGTGPAGETCKTCKYYTLKRMGGTYRKCWLIRASWTGGYATDIKANSLACLAWKPPEYNGPEPNDIFLELFNDGQSSS